MKPGATEGPDGHDHAVANADIRAERRISRSVEHCAARDEQIEPGRAGGLALLGLQRRGRVQQCEHDRGANGTGNHRDLLAG